MKYKLSIVTMFKNESMILEEWFKHYLNEGVDHFYLIDNGSTDNYEQIISKYKNYITLIKDPILDLKYKQNILIDKYFRELVKKESEWVFMCDVDEYLYSRNGFKTLKDYINLVDEHIDNIFIQWKIFGTNGYKNQPKCIIDSFTKRSKKCFYYRHGFGKSLSRTKKIKKLHNHHPQFDSKIETYDSNLQKFGEQDLKKKMANYNDYNLNLNHYMLMSEEYYKNVKCVRGCVQNKLSEKHDIEFFINIDKTSNEIDDFELKNKK